ncbi:N6-L-threonylcarbamoyladenine synthase [Hyphodiscus hymeniophilus]|uniref:N6-L-threonylcarbamoyladenine synthase n=1 Tax=Hyphodiscus hymeniophilus TaxID=353542 RepID=A0A9P7AYY8_9HELO|nr:N6-L-threonylcarbamoyladenine synthase [Hyphodiscus hymeniophilus]
MRLSCLHIRRFSPHVHPGLLRRNLLTLAIETSCDDTSVAIIERQKINNKLVAVVHFHEKITSDSKLYGGVHPIIAHESHQKNLAPLISRALQALPLKGAKQDDEENRPSHGVYLKNSKNIDGDWEICRKKPDFITVTRGPGMRANLITGMDTAKGLAVAWQIPLLGVNHMQAHALTPRMTYAIQRAHDSETPDLKFPFLTLLVSGGHTMLVHSKGLCQHEVLANTADIAVGDMIDKCARDIIPDDVLKSSKSVMYGPMLEEFAFHDWKAEKEHHESNKPTTTWSITPPLRNILPSDAQKYSALFSFSGIGSAVKRITSQNPTMDKTERQLLARATMRVAFEHLASRVIIALKTEELSATENLVVSGGVASNKYLLRVLRTALDANRHESVKLVFPPLEYCTDNAAMIAWAGMELFDAGYRSSLDIMALKNWAIDPSAKDGGILGVDGWLNVNSNGSCQEPDP